MNLKNITILAILFIMISIPAAIGGGGGHGFKQLRLEADDGSYIGNDPDAWLTDSTVISGNPTTINLGLVYKYSGKGACPSTIDGSHLILTTNLNPSTSGIQVTLSNMRYSDFGDTGIPDKTIAAGDWTQFPANKPPCTVKSNGENGLICYDYFMSNHGILQVPNWYVIVRLDDIKNNMYLKGDESNELLVDIAASATDSSTRMHIDSVGTTVDDHNKEKGVVNNPYSNDVTWQYIPEFPTVALPVATVFGIMYIMQRRRKEE